MIKSIVTMMLIATLVITTLFQIPIPELFKDVTLMVVTYFFGRYIGEKKEGEG